METHRPLPLAPDLPLIYTNQNYIVRWHAHLLEQIRLLPSREQVELVEEILERLPDVAEEDIDPKLSPEEVAELERRMAGDDADPSSGVPWIEVQREINRRFGFSLGDEPGIHLSQEAPNQ